MTRKFPNYVLTLDFILQLSHFPIVKEQAEVEVRAEGNPGFLM